MPETETGVLSVRHQKLRDALKSLNLSGMAINPGPSLSYLTNLHFHISERPVVLLFPTNGVPSLVLPELEKQKAESAEFEVSVFAYTELPETWGPAFESGISAAGLHQSTIGVEPRSLRVLELRFLEKAAPKASFVSGEAAVASLRMIKDEEELSLMRRATQIAERALLDTLPRVREGITEREIAGTLIRNMLEHGSAGELPFQPIIAFGPNSANPHAVPSEYALQRGDLVLFDWGANFLGYFSDLTRMFALGEPEPDLRHIVEIVERSNAAGRSSVKPGIRAGDIDRMTRGVIKSEGYGDFFVHRTGHGLGLEIHEEPYIRDDNDLLLRPGMTFTIEPGIYLSGRGGARIEDDIVVTSTGSECLSTLSRQLGILGE